MANLQQVGFTSPYGAEQGDIDRRRRLAEALQAQSMQPMETQMAGGWAIPNSPLQGAAKLAQAFASKKTAESAEQKQRELAENYRRDTGLDMQRLVQAMQGRQAQPSSPQEDAAGNAWMSDPIAAQSPLQGLQQALPGLQTPMGQQMASTALMQQMKPQEGYTLGPGAIRMGADNKPLAQAPFKPPEPDKDAGAWGDPYELNGAQVQKNSRTGEIRTAVSRASAPPVTNVSITPPSKVFENENKLRDDYTAATKSFTGIRDAYNTVKAALSGPITAVSTLAGATKFMKMIDPESVVRESELNMALKATGMLDRFMNLHNTVLKGQVLTPKQAEEIKTIAETLYTTAEKQQTQTDEYYKGLAKQYGLSPDRVVRKQGAVMRGNDRRDGQRDNKTVVVDY